MLDQFRRYQKYLQDNPDALPVIDPRFLPEWEHYADGIDVYTGDDCLVCGLCQKQVHPYYCNDWHPTNIRYTEREIFVSLTGSTPVNKMTYFR